MEETECVLKSTVEQLKHKSQDKQDEIDKLTMENQSHQIELETSMAKTNVSVNTNHFLTYPVSTYRHFLTQ